MVALNDDTALGVAGIEVSARASWHFAPQQILQCVKCYLRHEARKPIDMGIKTYLMHIIRINMQEIPWLPPNFNVAQHLSDDEVVDILLFGTPKSWQREMDR